MASTKKPNPSDASPPLPVPAKRKREIPPAARAHQFVKGQSGNPSGRPSGQSLRARIREMLDEPSDDGTPKKDRVISKLIALAIGGDRAACEYLIDQLEGKAVQQVSVDANTNVKSYSIVASPEDI